MLTLKVLSNPAQAAVYYEVDDYYVQGRQVAPSSWWGGGARRLGLDGEVDRNAFAELLHGRLPNGVVLEKGGTGKHRPGVDLTFSAPKSVSLLALVHGDDRILAAHENAVTVALAYLQRTAPRARRKIGGRVQLETTDNLVVARFNHDSSRARDPQLHSHVVVLNVTQRHDKEWKALSNEELFRSAKAAGTIYRAELAAKLRELGYGIERTHADGRFEVTGFSKEILDAFSQRRAQIVEHLEERGLEGPAAARIAARATRDRKQNVERSVLQQEWRDRANALGVDFERAWSGRKRLDHGQRRVLADELLDRAVAHLTERKVVFAERQLIQVAIGLGVGEVRLEDVQRSVARKVERGELVAAVSSRQKDPFAQHYTTDRLLAVEQDLVHLMARGRGCVDPIADGAGIDRLVGEIDRQATHRLTEGQADAIRLVLSTNDRVVGIQGYAGTGKTTGALLHIRRIAEENGFEVRGFAPSAAAASVLERDAGIASITLAMFLARNRKEQPKPKSPKLWIVDEASMMGNATARALLEAAERVDARVVLVGDRDQLPAIEAGCAFGCLMDRGMPVAKIETIVRQRDEELRRAVVETIHRKHQKALELVGPRVEEIPKRMDRLRAVAKAYFEIPADERIGALVVTPSNADRRMLNNLIQRGLERRGLLGAEQIESEILVAKNLTKADVLDMARYDAGDVVRFDQSYKRLRVEKNSYLTVKHVDRSTGVVLLDHDGREVRWKPSVASKVEVYTREARALRVGDLIRWTRNDHANERINAEVGRVVAVDRSQHRADVLVNGALHRLDLDRQGHWELAYATTIHAAQGRTADRVLLHLDTSKPHFISHEGWYVGISRARNELRIFTDSIDRLPDQIRTSLQQESALRAVVREERRQHIEPVVGPQPKLEQPPNTSQIEEHERRAARQRENVKRLVERQKLAHETEQRRQALGVPEAEQPRDREQADVIPREREGRKERKKKRDRDRGYGGFGFGM